ncbi:glutathione S-transferase theta-1-like, partial [Clarias magur]
MQTLLIERLGRRALIIGGYLLMSLWCVCFTLTLSFQKSSSWVPYLSMICIFAFILSFGLGPGGVTNILITELFTQPTRPAAYMIAGSVNWLSFFFISMLFPFIVVRPYCRTVTNVTELPFTDKPCRALIIFLTANNIQHTVHTVALRRGENRTPEFTKLNPMQKVPVMREDGFVLTESDAILKHLTAAHSVPDHWYPRQPQKRARVDEYTAWHHMNTRLHAAKVFITEVLTPRMTGQPVDDVRLQRALRDLDGTLDKLETMFLKDQDFLCGDDITLADLLAICELMQ